MSKNVFVEAGSSGASLLALPEDMRCKATVKQPKPLCTLLMHWTS